MRLDFKYMNSKFKYQIYEFKYQISDIISSVMTRQISDLEYHLKFNN